MGNVLKADAAAGNARARIDFSAVSEVWVEYDVFFDSAALTLWGVIGEDINELFAGGTSRHDLFIDSGQWTNLTGSGNVPPPTANVWQRAKLRFVKGDAIEFYIDGTLVFTDTDGGSTDITRSRFGMCSGNTDPACVGYFRDIKIGTTEGDDDIFAWPDSETDLSAWTLITGDVSVVPDPHVTEPAAPTLSSATAGDTAVTLAWTTPSTGGSPITGYSVYRSTTTGTETLLDELAVVTSYIDTDVTAGVTYFYKVSAANAIGEGALSNELSVVFTGPAGLVVSAAIGVIPGDFTERASLGATGSAARRPVRALQDRNVQVVTVRVAADGPTSSFQVFSFELNTLPSDPHETGGQ